MHLTIGNWVFIGIVILCGIGGGALAVFTAYDNAPRDKERKKAIMAAVISLIITVAVTAGSIFAINWWNTSTASGQRGYKDFQSNMDNGLEREIVITAEDGREIFRHSGKFDVERHADGDDRYLRFEHDGKRYTISYGVLDTVTIIEKE